MKLIHTPLEQFEIIREFTIIPYILEVSNLTGTLVFYTLMLIPICAYLLLSQKGILLVPTRFQTVMENFFLFVENLLISNSTHNNQQHIPLFKTVTLILLLLNLIGMIPYQFTLTSHIFITFFLSFVVFFGINMIGVNKHKEKYLALFLPSGTPLPIAPLLLVIELVSFYSRVFSLAIRLFANIMSGHTLLAILTTFLFSAYVNGSIFLIINILPTALILAIIGLELAIAFVQVYVFMTLLALYISDLYNVSH